MCLGLLSLSSNSSCLLTESSVRAGIPASPHQRVESFIARAVQHTESAATAQDLRFDLVIRWGLAHLRDNALHPLSGLPQTIVAIHSAFSGDKCRRGAVSHVPVTAR